MLHVHGALSHNIINTEKVVFLNWINYTKPPGSTRFTRTKEIVKNSNLVPAYLTLPSP